MQNLSRALWASTIVIISFLIATGVGAQRAAPRIPVHLDLLWSSGYDDNIFRLSQRDINRFKSGTERYPNPNSTWDDWRNDFGVTLTLPWTHANGWQTRLEGSAKIALYATNHRKNYQRYAASLRQYFGKIWWVEGSFSVVPSYYLREYLDRDLGIREGCDYESRNYEAKLRYRSPWRTYIYPFFEFQTLYYNRYFTEFDAEWSTVGLAFDQLLSRRWGVSGTYSYTNGKNVGGGGPTAASLVDPFDDTQYGDGDFHENEIRGAINYEPRRIFKKKWEISLSGRIRLREYITTNSQEIDPFHADRKDTRWEISPRVTMDVMRNLTGYADFLYEQRTTDSPVGYVREFKDFVRRTYFIGLEYQLLPPPRRRR
jgi:hypothetical protein